MHNPIFGNHLRRVVRPERCETCEFGPLLGASGMPVPDERHDHHARPSHSLASLRRNAYRRDPIELFASTPPDGDTDETAPLARNEVLFLSLARVAELVDARDSKSRPSNGVRVRFSPRALR
jgi:hypothetical protein